MADLKDITFTANNLAGILGLTGARVGQLRDDGIITMEVSRRYKLEAITEYLKWYRGNPAGKAGKLDTDAERARLIAAQADKAERENKIADKKVAPVEYLEAALANVLAQMVAIFDAMPMNLKRSNPKLTARDIHMIKKDLATLRNLAADVSVKENIETGN